MGFPSALGLDDAANFVTKKPGLGGAIGGAAISAGGDLIKSATSKGKGQEPAPAAKTAMPSTGVQSLSATQAPQLQYSKKELPMPNNQNFANQMLGRA